MSLDMYKMLPDFTGPYMFPEKQMAHYRDNIRPYLQFCGLAIIPRLTPWCEYIKDYDLKVQPVSHFTDNRRNSNNQSLTTLKSIPFIINDVRCYDSYYCNVQSLAGTIHALMVAISILSLIGLFSNLYCFIKMHLKHNKNFKRNPFGIYFTSIILVDFFHIVFGWFIFIVPGLAGGHYEVQLMIYQTFSYIIVPFLLPFWDLTCNITTWLNIALLIQRSNITRSKLLMEAEGRDPNVMSASKRRKTYGRLALIICALFIYTIPKFAEYTFNRDFRTGKGIIIPLLRVFKLYRIIMLKFLSPGIECLIPIIIMLAYIVVIKYHETVLTRRKMSIQINREASNEQLINPNAKVLSAAGVSRKTQLVIWIAVLVLINLIMKVSNVFVGLEQSLPGSQENEWPRLKQIVKYMSFIISVITVTLKPLVYIHCCPRLLRKDLSYSQKDFQVTKPVI